MSGSLSSLAEATDATLALETESSDDDEEAGAGACDLDLRRPPFRPRVAPSRHPDPGTCNMFYIVLGFLQHCVRSIKVYELEKKVGASIT